MKISFRRRQQGNILLAIIVLLFAIVAIVYVAYKLITSIQKIGPRKLPNEITSIETVKAEAVAALQAELESELPNMQISITAADISLVPAFVPFPDATNGEVIQWTTNTVDWQTVTGTPPGESFADTNQYPYALYRILGETVTPSTNASWRLQRMQQ